MSFSSAAGLGDGRDGWRRLLSLGRRRGEGCRAVAGQVRYAFEQRRDGMFDDHETILQVV